MMARLRRSAIIFGGEGDDTITGAAAGEILNGDRGNDVLSGGLGDDTVIGGSGDDEVRGGAGADVVYGGLGDDFLIYTHADEAGEGPTERFFGGGGGDTLVLEFDTEDYSTEIAAEIGAFADALNDGRDPGDGGEFAFRTFGLRVAEVEDLLLFVGGREVQPGEAPAGAPRDDFFETDDNQVLVADVSDNDGAVEGDTFTLGQSVARGMLDLLSDGAFTFDPGDEFLDLSVGETATAIFTYTLFPAGESSGRQATATITINGANETPTAADVAGTTSEDAQTAFNLLARSGAADIDRLDVLSIAAVNGVALDGGSLSFVTSRGGAVTVSADGAFSYDPRGAFDGLAAGAADVETLSFTVADGQGGVVTRDATITITGVNDAPAAVDDAATTDQDTFIDIDVLANDSDVDDGFAPEFEDIVIAFDERGSAGGSLVSDGGLFFDPGGDFDGLGAGESRVTTFTYTIRDLAGATDAATVSVTVNGLNDAPTADGFADATSEDEALPGDIILGTEASDPDANDELRVTAVNGAALNGGAGTFTLASGATLSIAAAGAFTYDPAGAFDFLAEGETGLETFTVAIGDGNGGAADIDATITITGVNDAPDAMDDAAATDQNTFIGIDVLANDVDVDDGFAPDAEDVITAFDARGSAGGAIISDGGFFFDPNGDFDGLGAGESRETTFTYTIRDLAGATDTATATVTVAGVNDAPTVARVFSDETSEDDALDGDFIDGAGASDIDENDELRVTAVDGMALNGGAGTLTLESGATLTVAAGGAFTYDPGGAFDVLADDDEDLQEITVTIGDGNGGFADIDVEIVIAGANDAPVANEEIVLELNQSDEPAEIDLLDPFFDAEGDDLSVKSVSQVSGRDVFAVDGFAGLRFDGAAAGEYAGGDVAALGDLNGDGLTDFFISANDYTDGGVFFGGREALERIDAADGSLDGIVDFGALGPTDALRISSRDGLVVDQSSQGALGDVNGDGFGDFLVTASNAGTGGEAYVIFGGADLIGAFGGALTPDDLDGTNGFVIGGADAEDGFGFAVSRRAPGDVTGDGAADLLISAPGGDGGNVGGGETYVITGDDLAANADATGFVDIDDLVADASYRIDGFYDEATSTTITMSGESLAAGDIDGDGVSDLLIGSPATSRNFNNDVGRAFLVFGGADNLEALDGADADDNVISLDLIDGDTGFQFLGAGYSDRAGTSLAVVGDVNGDGFNEIAIGAPEISGEGATGQVYLIFGGRDNLAALDAADGTRDGGIELGRVANGFGYQIDGAGYYEGAGVFVSDAGDLDGDGVADLLIGNSGETVGGDVSESVGRAYIVFGGQLEALDLGGQRADGRINLRDLDGATGFTLESRSTDASGFGLTSDAADVNGDGLTDIIVGAYGYDPQGRENGGSAFVIFGGSEAFADLDRLDGAADGTIDVSLVPGAFRDFSVPPQGAFASDGGSASFDPSRFANLAEGQTEQVVLEYEVSDGRASSVNKINVTITGENDAPETTALTAATTDADDSFMFDILTGQTDVDDGAALSVENFTEVGSEFGGTVDGSTFSFDATTLGLQDGARQVITYEYEVVDEFGARAANQFTLIVDDA